MRVFFAVELEQCSREALNALAGTAREYCSGRWVRPENYHITLRFLGEQPLPVIQRIKETTHVEEMSAFPYRIGRIGRFRRSGGDILWAGVSMGEERFAGLKHSLDAALAKLGFEPEERPYHPHITLARDVRWEGSFQALQEQGISIGETVLGFALMESRPTAEGVRYIPLARWVFNK